MNTGNHPLTENTVEALYAAVPEGGPPGPSALRTWEELTDLARDRLTRLARAAYSIGEAAAGPDDDPNVETIENARLDDVRAGDHLTWTEVREFGDATNTRQRKGIAHHRAGHRDWYTKDNIWITDGEGEGITLTIRRTVRELPTKPETVIIPNDGHKAVEATRYGIVWRTREAVLGSDGRWHGVWYRADSQTVIGFIDKEYINPATCKERDQ